MTDSRTEDIRADLRTSLAQILYRELDEIEDDVTFTALGLDSILGVELIIGINKRYALSEKIQLLYAAPTVNELASYLQDATAEAKPHDTPAL
ncbi:Polyketide synthase PksL [Streptomyces avidinii]